MSFLTERTGAGAGGGEVTMTMACFEAGAGKKRQSCNRHGHPATRAWGPEAQAAQETEVGPLGHPFLQGRIFSGPYKSEFFCTAKFLTENFAQRNGHKMP